VADCKGDLCAALHMRFAKMHKCVFVLVSNALRARDLYASVFPLGFNSSITKCYRIFQSVTNLPHEMLQPVIIERVGGGCNINATPVGGSGGMGVSFC
jgi:hypothetical protein